MKRINANLVTNTSTHIKQAC